MKLLEKQELISDFLKKRNNTVLEAYRQHVEERAALGVPPKPLDDAQTAALVELLKNPPAGEEAFLVDLLENRVPAGVDQAAYVKAAFLAAVAKGEATSPLVSKERAVYLLGTMLGGYNVAPLVELLDDAELASLAAEALKKLFSYLMHSMTLLTKRKRVTKMRKQFFNLGLMLNGSHRVQMFQKKSKSLYLK
jgi:aconitase B